MPQNPYLVAKNPSNVLVPLKVTADGELEVTPGAASIVSGDAVPLLVDRQGALLTSPSVNTHLNVTTATVISAVATRLVRINVQVAGAVGTANDVATVGAVAAANQICVIPAAVGTIELNWPCNTGLVISPGAAQVVAVSYN